MAGEQREERDVVGHQAVVTGTNLSLLEPDAQKTREPTSALETFTEETSAAAQHWRFALEARQTAANPEAPCVKLTQWRALGLQATRRQRMRLDELCLAQVVGPDAFLIIQEELDFTEVALGNDRERHIEEN